ncbi:MAG: hypothetical protein AAF614_15105 [Chloroflexota bacterium]
MQKPLQPGHYYHIYNRGNNGENIFLEKRNYLHFLKLYLHHIVPIAETFAYCLLKNHFHLLICTKATSISEINELDSRYITRQFNNFFIAYTKSINNGYNRTGSLFAPRFKRKPVDNERYFTYLVAYIHRNPQTHGFVDDFRSWPWSSYQAMLSEKPTNLERGTVLDWFGGVEPFVDAHRFEIDEQIISSYVEGDW